MVFAQKMGTGLVASHSLTKPTIARVLQFKRNGVTLPVEERVEARTGGREEGATASLQGPHVSGAVLTIGLRSMPVKWLE